MRQLATQQIVKYRYVVIRMGLGHQPEYITYASKISSTSITLFKKKKILNAGVLGLHYIEMLHSISKQEIIILIYLVLLNHQPSDNLKILLQPTNQPQIVNI